MQAANTLRPRQNGRFFPDGIFTCIFLNGNVRISVKISLKFVLKGSINNIPSLVQIMAWRRPGDKPLSESMMVWLPTHICVARPQWVKTAWKKHTLPLSIQQFAWKYLLFYLTATWNTAWICFYMKTQNNILKEDKITKCRKIYLTTLQQHSLSIS